MISNERIFIIFFLNLTNGGISVYSRSIERIVITKVEITLKFAVEREILTYID